MSKEYYNPEDTDVTKYYLRKVLEQKAPQLSKLSSAFSAINIDRVIQSYIDSVVTPPSKIDSLEKAMFFAGQMDMANRMKQFLCNLNNISVALEEGDVTVQDIIDNDVISSADMDLANKLINKGK